MNAEFTFLSLENTDLNNYFRVTINYSAENIGTADIQSYEVFFNLTQFDGVITTQSHESGFIGIGKTRFEAVPFDLNDAVEFVTVEDFNLK